MKIRSPSHKSDSLSALLTLWVWIQKYTTAVATPAEKAALGKEVDGSPASGQVNYASVIEMLLYLGHSHPNIAFATHQCTCYTFAPKQVHEDALKCIGHYLKGTLDKGLIYVQVLS